MIVINILLNFTATLFCLLSFSIIYFDDPPSMSVSQKIQKYVYGVGMMLVLWRIWQ